MTNGTSATNDMHTIDQRIAANPGLKESIHNDPDLSHLTELTRHEEDLKEAAEDAQTAYQEAMASLDELRDKRNQLIARKVTGEYGAMRILRDITGLSATSIRSIYFRVTGESPDPARSTAARRPRPVNTVRDRILGVLQSVADEAGEVVYLSNSEIKERGDVDVPSYSNVIMKLAKDGEVHRPYGRHGFYGIGPSEFDVSDAA